MRLTLTDEALPPLPLYVSRVREPRGCAELEALLDAVALELRSKAHVALYRVPITNSLTNGSKSILLRRAGANLST
jgi:hypothetical protein